MSRRHRHQRGKRAGHCGADKGRLGAQGEVAGSRASCCMSRWHGVSAGREGRGAVAADLGRAFAREALRQELAVG